MDHTLHEGELKHRLLHTVVVQLITEVYHWIDSLDLKHIMTDVPCYDHIKVTKEKFTMAISK